MKKQYNLVIRLAVLLLIIIILLLDFNKPLKGKVDYIVVNKNKREFQGDGKTPEGTYYINDKNPNSIAYKNLGISYPNSADIQNSKLLGKPAGGDIKIHGLMKKWNMFGSLHRFIDWTGGCIAVSNSEIDELYKNVPMGTKIIINP